MYYGKVVELVDICFENAIDEPVTGKWYRLF